jgi:hypothetical protein
LCSHLSFFFPPFQQFHEVLFPFLYCYFLAHWFLFLPLSVYVFPHLPLCSYFFYLFLLPFPLLLLLSLHLSLYLLFASRNLLLSILFLLHPLNAFTTSLFACSHSLSHHPFFFPTPFAPLTITSFFFVAFSITSFSSVTIFSISCSLNVASSSLLLYSFTPCSLYTFTITFFSSSLISPFSFSSWFVPSMVISRGRWSESTLSPTLNSFTLSHAASFIIA